MIDRLDSCKEKQMKKKNEKEMNDSDCNDCGIWDDWGFCHFPLFSVDLVFLTMLITM